jgi:hypothetical protein
MSLSRFDLVVSSLAASACVLGPRAAPAQTSSSDIVVANPNIFPESVAYDATTQKFYVDSLRYGHVTSVDKRIRDDGPCSSTLIDPNFACCLSFRLTLEGSGERKRSALTMVAKRLRNNELALFGKAIRACGQSEKRRAVDGLSARSILPS